VNYWGFFLAGDDKRAGNLALICFNLLLLKLRSFASFDIGRGKPERTLLISVDFKTSFVMDEVNK